MRSRSCMANSAILEKRYRNDSAFHDMLTRLPPQLRAYHPAQRREVVRRQHVQLAGKTIRTIRSKNGSYVLILRTPCFHKGAYASCAKTADTISQVTSLPLPAGKREILLISADYAMRTWCTAVIASCGF
jgi:hypothetical protein